MHLVHTLRAGEPGVRGSMATTSKYETKEKEDLHGKARKGLVMLEKFLLVLYFLIFRQYGDTFYIFYITA